MPKLSGDCCSNLVLKISQKVLKINRLFRTSTIGFLTFPKWDFELEKAFQRGKNSPPEDFLEDIENGCEIWGVDPGVATLVTAVDTSGRQRTTSLEEYYHLCGYNDANSIRKKHQEQHKAQFLKISNLSSLKTSNMAEFLKACKERLSLYDDITSYYNEKSWSSKLKFKCYIRKQKGVHEICKRFIHGSAKYDEKATTGVRTSTKKENRYYLSAPIDHEKRSKKTIIAFGDET
ncbi:hypothetical protein RO3G_15974 [Rhizopus delemar RA 99-880]|uniref:Uncharacterized protein n=1 Tax=Rhizopus delemar (strain RA 99-880 / ATCC MYA-4621 / FGSC 9543 / NRRL 43880) TaxID=246409 RepID=I1CS33_RHIO9|nr:hypothetical protein RO3G_15974 [Rhizopus delemar RA 99-880]|eukprot:EIE91263.1 hypothetical protein RO3G_15974 [Rhizopus delemar RA 99-880]